MSGKSEKNVDIIKTETPKIHNYAILPQLENLRDTLPLEGAVRIELVEGIPMFRASTTVKNRIQELLDKQQTLPLNPDEEQELNLYEEIDDYLSFVNRTVRNLFLGQIQPTV